MGMPASVTKGGLEKMLRDKKTLSKTKSVNPKFMWLICALWCALIAGGFVSLMVYSGEAGEMLAVDGFPSDAGTPNTVDAWHLVMGIHPKCSCSHATAEELNRLVANLDKRMVCEVFVFHPENDPDFANTSLARSLESIPGLILRSDPNGLLSDIHGIQTSGGCVLYSPDGKRMFVGGITPARGHAGDNLGSSAINAFVLGNRCPWDRTRAFGCSIQGHGETR